MLPELSVVVVVLHGFAGVSAPAFARAVTIALQVFSVSTHLPLYLQKYGSSNGQPVVDVQALLLRAQEPLSQG